MIEPISWHKDCLKNRKASLDRKREELETLQRQVDDQARAYNLLNHQIKTATKEGAIAFNAESYIVRRGDYENA